VKVPVEAYVEKVYDEGGLAELGMTSLCSVQAGR